MTIIEEEDLEESEANFRESHILNTLKHSQNTLKKSSQAKQIHNRQESFETFGGQAPRGRATTETAEFMSSCGGGTLSNNNHLKESSQSTVIVRDLPQHNEEENPYGGGKQTIQYKDRPFSLNSSADEGYGTLAKSEEAVENFGK